MEPTPTSPAAWRERLAPRDSDGQSDVESPGWLEVDGRPLDWNGPAGRPFSRLRAEDLDRSILDHVEGAVRRHPERIALVDSDGWRKPAAALTRLLPPG